MPTSPSTVVVRVRQSISGPEFTHHIGQLVEMPEDVADAYYQANVVEGVGDHNEEDVVPYGQERRGAPPAGRRATSEPGGRQATDRPAGGDTSRRPAGQDRDDDEPSPSDDDVPDKVDDVKAWVGDDPDRAAVALEVERARARGPRATLEPWLDERATVSTDG